LDSGVDIAPEALVAGLLSPSAFEHEVSQIELVETHISWLILTEEYAYKLKKPLVLDFLDFGDLDKRRHFCEEEVRLNKPHAPALYIDVVPVTMFEGQPRFGGSGKAVEYAVRMRRFDQSLRLDRQLEGGKLTAMDMRELASVIAERHRLARRVDAGDKGRVLRLTREFMLDNFRALDGHIDADVLGHLESWTESELEKHATLLADRFDAGRVRDCHGDLHLGNLVRLEGGITTFDCIEFDSDLRHIDVMADIAFLVMDLVERAHSALAAHFLNRYLESTGDYAGIAVLDLFFVYRCLVRAKVAVIRAAGRDGDNEPDLEEARRYCDMAARQAAPRRPVLLLMHGFSGSGKTRVSTELMAAMPAIRIRSDVERKRLFGLAETAASESDIGAGIYSGSAGDRVYSRLLELAGVLLASEHNVILDAAFLDLGRRSDAIAVAEDVGCTALIVDVNAPADVLRQRLQRRAVAGRDASEADVSVLSHQLANADKLTEVERRITIDCDNSVSPDFDKLAKKVAYAASDR
jgi:aminoglycoside phosphotransferase family enzyme/predicted kinase